MTQLPISEWRVLWFSPNAGLWEPSQLEHDLANGLVDAGAHVTLIRCRGIFNSFCPTMQANELSVSSPASQKKSICRECIAMESAFSSVAKYETLWLDDFVTPEASLQVSSDLKGLSQGNWRDFGGYAMPVNVYATYLSMLHHKVGDVTASERSWHEYVSDLRNSLYAILALPLIFTHVNPTHGFVYNPLYPTNRVFAELTIRNPKIQYVGLSAGGYIPSRYSTIALYRSIQSSQTAVDSPNIVESMKVPLSLIELELVARHLGQLIQGSDPWVYSSPPSLMPVHDIHERLGTDESKPIAVVLVGSPDETRSSALVGAEYERVPIGEVSLVVEFIEQALLAARDSPTIDFVFRLHPRLAPNKRESLRSPDLLVIEEILEKRSPNVFINAPGDGIGLYDVARIATIGINHASSAGLELLALGIPVIHYDPPRLNAYPPSLGITVERFDVEQFADAINKAIHSPRSVNTAIKAWRWYAVTLIRSITHKSFAQKPVRMERERPRQTLLWLRRVVPKSLRERISRRLALRGKTTQIVTESSIDGSEMWIQECIDRISQFDDTIEWNPLTVVRGQPLSIDAEISAIQSATEHLLRTVEHGYPE